MTQNRYDIIIIGGGMVGASLACALRETHLRIALIDATPLNIKTDPRLIALNYSSYCLFQNLNLWSSLAINAAPIHQVHVSDRGHFGKVRLNATDLQLPVLGYVVPANHINGALNTALNTQHNLTILRPATLKTLTQQDHHAEVLITTDKGEIKLEGALIIGADGSHSTVREQLGLISEEVDYQQSALVTVTELNRAHQQVAYERFHPGGAIAMLPLVGLQCATIWSDQSDRIQELLHVDDKTFLQTLQENFGYRLGRLKNIGKRHVYPLKMLKCKQTIKNHVLLMGNAAHTLHPIAAQGLNLALAETAMLAQCITEQTDKLAHGDWQAYLAWQDQQQTASATLSHQLPQWFGQEASLLVFARQIGMVGLDILPSAKRYFSKKALGRSGLLPRLLLEKN